jgi:glyceraldehyde 3-phosphate dehydrogenase
MKKEGMRSMKKTKIAINGLGRIGRSVLRALVEEGYDDIELVAVNGPAKTEAHRHLLQYDSVHGRFPVNIGVEGETLVIGSRRIPVLHERDITKIDWKATGAEIVLECTGAFNAREDAEKHLRSGARTVILSAPAKSDDIPTYVYGVNHQGLREEDTIFSIGSCTTNCLAPVAQVIHERFGIASGFMTTVHSYTADQNLVDGSHSDLRRARAAALSMIPTSTGAAKMIGKVLPELSGRLDGTAIRVPTPNVSLVDLAFQSQRPMTKAELNTTLREAAAGHYAAVMAATEEPLVSIDFTHRRESAVVDLTGTAVPGAQFGRVAAWYDNEWGFSCRMLDLARCAAQVF